MADLLHSSKTPTITNALYLGANSPYSYDLYGKILREQRNVKY